MDAALEALPSLTGSHSASCCLCNGSRTHINTAMRLFCVYTPRLLSPIYPRSSTLQYIYIYIYLLPVVVDFCALSLFSNDRLDLKYPSRLPPQFVLSSLSFFLFLCDPEMAAASFQELSSCISIEAVSDLLAANHRLRSAVPWNGGFSAPSSTWSCEEAGSLSFRASSFHAKSFAT